MILALLLFNVTPASIPRPLGWVSDYAGIFDRSGVEMMTRAITSIKASTGAEIAVVTQNSLGEFGSREEMALAYLEKWGIGEQGKDNGLLILILYDRSSNLKEYRFETGLGLEGDLPDGLLGQIAREEMVPRFRAGDFTGGVLASVVRIGNTLGADLGQVPAAPQNRVKGKKGIGSLVFFIFFIIALLSRGRRGGGLLGLFLLGSMMGSRGRVGGLGGGGFGGGGFGGFGGGGGGAGGGAGGSW
jgi:uncharacterized protein